MTKLDVLNKIASAITGTTVAAPDIKSAIDIIAAKGKGSAVSSETIAESLSVCDTYIENIIGSDIVVESNKTTSITANGTVEITPTSGSDAMAKVTATVNVPTTPVTPPTWYTSGKDSVPPAEYSSVLVFADNINSFDGVYGNSLFPDGTSTIAELYLQRVESATAVQSVSYFGSVPNGENPSADIFVFDAE